MIKISKFTAYFVSIRFHYHMESQNNSQQKSNKDFERIEKYIYFATKGFSILIGILFKTDKKSWKK